MSKKRPRVVGYTPPKTYPYYLPTASTDVSGVRIIGEVTVETRGAIPLSRPGDVAKSLFGARVIR